MASPASTISRRAATHWANDTTVVVACVLVTVLLRLPFLAMPLGIDEGGYAYVASQWGSGAGELYGEQWVDRPPLLFALYVVAIGLAGDIGVRLLGCVAAVVVVLTTADASRRLAGAQAMRWTAVVATVLTASTVTQAYTVNAELPAIALTSTSIWLLVCALMATESRRALTLAGASGAMALSAVLVKQSFIDAYVFAVVTIVAMMLGRSAKDRAETRRRMLGLLVAGTAGTLLVLAPTILWAEVRGPGFAALLDALYGFRIDVRDVIASSPDAPNTRAVFLLLLAAVSGLLTLYVLVTVGLLRIAMQQRASKDGAAHPLLGAASIGLVALGGFAIFAVSAGGNWWLHYLIQPVPFLAMGSGVVIASPRGRSHHTARHARRWAQILIVTTLIAWFGAVGWMSVEGTQNEPVAVGTWLREASGSDDTALVTWGHANVLRVSGLRSSYSLAWSLPVRTQDPQLRGLYDLMQGPDAPTWIVEWRPINSWGLDRGGRVRATVRQRYDRVARVCNKQVYRLREAGSAAVVASLPPVPSDACGSGRELRIRDVKIF